MFLLIIIIFYLQRIDGSYVCVALPSQYKIIHCDTGSAQDLFPYNCDTFRPIVTSISKVSLSCREGRKGYDLHREYTAFLLSLHLHAG